LDLERKHILILPRWYPNKKDIQLGIFIQNQAILLKNDFEISVIYVQSDENIKDIYQINQQTIHGINEQIVYFKRDTSPLKKLINFRRYKIAQKLAYFNLKRKVDICHVHVPIRPVFLALYLLKKKNIPFVITEHWSGHLTGEFNKKNKLYKRYYNRILNKSSKVSCVSEFLKVKFLENTGYVPLVIPNYIEKNTHEISQKNGKINFLSVNDFSDKIKNISGIVRAFHSALEINSNIHLTLVGDGPDFKKISTQIEKSKIKEISLIGRVDNRQVLEEMSKCDIYISNSNFETFGMTIAEALMAGKPVISTQSGGPNEFLNSSNSIEVTKNNVANLSSAILKMADTYKTYNSKNLASNIESQYGKSIIMDKLNDLYKI
jgi:glycosyltransferase involved in cell wall biosynthesis